MFCVYTGSPLQNNLTEYHCMIDFINHGFLGSLNEFRNQYEIPIMNGEAKDARPEDVKRMKVFGCARKCICIFAHMYVISCVVI